MGPCHVLVNTAAVLRPGGLDTLSPAGNAVLSVNLTGYFLCAQIFGRQMRAQGRGSIVHIASVAGSNAQGHSGAYSVSKAGVVMLSQQLANEWGPHGIRSNVVSPGLVVTPMSQSFYDTPGVTERRKAVVPMRRIGMPQDMANAILSWPATAPPISAATRSPSRRLRAHADEPGAEPGVRVRIAARSVYERFRPLTALTASRTAAGLSFTKIGRLPADITVFVSGPA